MDRVTLSNDTDCHFLSGKTSSIKKSPRMSPKFSDAQNESKSEHKQDTIDLINERRNYRSISMSLWRPFLWMASPFISTHNVIVTSFGLSLSWCTYQNGNNLLIKMIIRETNFIGRAHYLWIDFVLYFICITTYQNVYDQSVANVSSLSSFAKSC